MCQNYDMPKIMKLLPGELDVDEALVATAVVEIRRIHRTGVLHTALAVGEYVVRTFFDGDLELFRAREAGHVSYARLAEDPELGMKAAGLWTAVNLLGQREVLGKALTEQLSLSHHRVLLSVKDEERKRELAELVLEEGLDREALTELTRKQRRGARPGVKALPLWFKTARKGAKELRKLGQLEGRDAVSPSRWEELRALVAEADEAWAELKAMLEEDDARE